MIDWDTFRLAQLCHQQTRRQTDVSTACLFYTLKQSILPLYRKCVSEPSKVCFATENKERRYTCRVSYRLVGGNISCIRIEELSTLANKLELPFKKSTDTSF
ncbi:hypothetical protein PoB_002870000 [Plakobranchus ocellatus]|uniref:Uncharacterized protein n=1 Tax=Plakobranchus ocellatus TaxID=259542 RepID=A0AAV4A467_9GAST|nr:hypothetical protein PoB_002870000 [Plakobranchus ocellatus]